MMLALSIILRLQSCAHLRPSSPNFSRVCRSTRNVQAFTQLDRSLSKMFTSCFRREVSCDESSRKKNKKTRHCKFLALPSQSQESYFLPNKDMATSMLLDRYECVWVCVCMFRRIANIFKNIWLGNRLSVTVLTCNGSRLTPYRRK